MDKEYKCPNCGKVLSSSFPRLSVIDTRTFGKLVPENILIEIAIDFECVCGTEVTIREALPYKRA